MILVDVEGVTARRPDRPLFEDLSVTVSTGDRLGVVGRNGAGKSTLLRVLAGVGEPEQGAVRRGRGVRIAFLDQHPTLPPGTVRGAVGSASGGGGWEAAAILDRLGMGDLGDADVSTLSGGQAKRVALAQALLEEVDLLVLDEPTNHLDIDAIAWLEDRLAGFGGGLVLVTHDRHVLDRVTTRILELDRGQGYVHNDGYAGYLAARSERGEREVAADAVRRNLARSELAWLRRGAPARTRKPKARITSATAIVEGRGPVAASTVDLELGGITPRLGDRVVDLVGVGAPLRRRVDVAVPRPRPRLGAGRPAGDRGGQRDGQVHPPRHPRRPPLADRGTSRHRPHRPDRVLRPGRRRPRPHPTGAGGGGGLERAAHLGAGTAHGAVPVRRRRPVGADRDVVGRRAASIAIAAGAGRDAQRPPPRRAHQRPRPRHPPGPGGLPGELARLSGRRQPRPRPPGADGGGRARARRCRRRPRRPRRLRRV